MTANAEAALFWVGMGWEGRSGEKRRAGCCGVGVEVRGGVAKGAGVGVEVRGGVANGAGVAAEETALSGI